MTDSANSVLPPSLGNIYLRASRHAHLHATQDKLLGDWGGTKNKTESNSQTDVPLVFKRMVYKSSFGNPVPFYSSVYKFGNACVPRYVTRPSRGWSYPIWDRQMADLKKIDL